MTEVYETTGKLVVAPSSEGAGREKWMGTPAELGALLGAPSASLVTEITLTAAPDGAQRINVIWEP